MLFALLQLLIFFSLLCKSFDPPTQIIARESNVISHSGVLYSTLCFASCCTGLLTTPLVISYSTPALPCYNLLHSKSKCCDQLYYYYCNYYIASAGAGADADSHKEFERLEEGIDQIDPASPVIPVLRTQGGRDNNVYNSSLFLFNTGVENFVEKYPAVFQDEMEVLTSCRKDLGDRGKKL